MADFSCWNLNKTLTNPPSQFRYTSDRLCLFIFLNSPKDSDALLKHLYDLIHWEQCLFQTLKIKEMEQKLKKGLKQTKKSSIKGMFTLLFGAVTFYIASSAFNELMKGDSFKYASYWTSLLTSSLKEILMFAAELSGLGTLLLCLLYSAIEAFLIGAYPEEKETE